MRREGQGMVWNCSYTTWHGIISYIISPATAFPRNPDPSHSDPMYVARQL